MTWEALDIEINQLKKKILEDMRESPSGGPMLAYPTSPGKEKKDPKRREDAQEPASILTDPEAEKGSP